MPVTTRYRLSIFLGAFLLFLVQPMSGKMVLPRFGGGPGVWTACMLFFQILLLAGYAYSHWITVRLPRGTQGLLHAALIVAAVLCLPLFIRRVTPPSTGDPVWAILLMLGATVGLPYFLLSSTAPLLQAWYWSEMAAPPYRLYALSNAASFLALLSYPVLVEPWITLRTQTWIWSILYVGFAVLTIWLALEGRAESPVNEPADEHAEPQEAGRPIYWIALSACGSALLLAATNHMCQEVAIIPFLWVVPLALYLLTFMLAFDRPVWYRPQFFALLAAILVPLDCWMMTLIRPRPFWQELAADALTMTVCCMICHGELARSRPHARRLTSFYLAIAAGGALGGVFVAVVAPRVFVSYRELPLALAATGLLVIFGRRPIFSRASLAVNLAMVLVVTGGVMGAISMDGRTEGGIFAGRNFFGTLRVSEDVLGQRRRRTLVHGRTVHGTEIMEPASLKNWASLYYTNFTAVGMAFDQNPKRFIGTDPKLHVGVVGLGVGTIAALAHPGDTVRFYEINPMVEYVARHQFEYLSTTKGAVEVVLGDARIRLAEEPPQNFDVLVVDAFNSDAIPAHLLTLECADVYRRHLKPDGLLLFHTSTKALNLGPVTRAIADRLGWDVALFSTEVNPGVRAGWVVITKNRMFESNPFVNQGLSDWSGDNRVIPWTDDFTSLLPVLRYSR